MTLLGTRYISSHVLLIKEYKLYIRRIVEGTLARVIAARPSSGAAAVGAQQVEVMDCSWNYPRERRGAMDKIIWGWSAVYAIGVGVWAIFMAKRYFLSNKK